MNTKGLGILLGVVLMALLVRLLFILPAGGKNLLALALLFLLLSMSQHPPAYAVGAGWSLGISSLGKPEIAAFIPFVMIWFFLVHRDWKKRILSVALFLVAFSLLVGPWIVRNYRTYGRVVPLSTNGGINFALGWDRAYLAQIGVKAPFHLDRTSSFGKQDEVERDRSYYGATWKAIAADPIAAIQVYLGKIVHFWNPALASVHPRFVRLVSLGTFSWVLLLGWTGLVKELFRGHRVRSSLFFMLFLCTTLVHALYLPNIRFRVATVDLYLLLFTGALLADLCRTLWTKASGQSPLLSRKAG